MINFAIKGSYITNRTTAEIWQMFDKLSFIKSLKGKKFQMMINGSIEEQDNGCKIEYTVFPEVICIVLFILYISVCVCKLYLDVMKGFSISLDWVTVLSVILMLLPAIAIFLESRSQQNICKERLEYLLSEGKTIILL